MNRSLFLQAICKFTLGVVLVGVLIFLPAGTLRYNGGWLLMGILFVPMFAAGLVMLVKNPSLLEHRLQAKETEAEQSMVIKCSGLMFLVGFVLAGLNFRFGWISLPRWVTVAGTVLFLLSYVLYAEVLRENTWLSRTIEVQENQTVVDTGLYGIVRHPMYAVTVVLFLSMPLVLGSLPTLLVFCFYPALIVKRIRNEETVLERDLQGYKAYQEKVKYRLFPGIW